MLTGFSHWRVNWTLSGVVEVKIEWEWGQKSIKLGKFKWMWNVAEGLKCDWKFYWHNLKMQSCQKSLMSLTIKLWFFRDINYYLQPIE